MSVLMGKTAKQILRFVTSTILLFLEEVQFLKGLLPLNPSLGRLED